MLWIRTILITTFVLTFGADSALAADEDSDLRRIYNLAIRYTAAIEFPNLVSGDPVLGQAQFGVAPDDLTIDTSHALFQGTSIIAGPVVSNGTACSTCHRPNNHFLLPPLPISVHTPPGDPLIPGRSAEAQGDPRMVLQEALARHNVEKNPADFEAHYNLASMLQARDKLDEATAQYEAALRIRPDDAVANNAFGGLLAATSHGNEAAARFAAALKSRPDYFDAHYDLGIVLATQGDYRGAIEHFSAAVRLNPQDAAAEANLGSALALAGQLPEAKQHLEKALQLDPQNTLAHENLEQLRERR